MDEQAQGLIDSIQGSEPALIIGAALVLLTAIVRIYLDPRLEGRAKQIVSAVSAWVGGIAVLLAVGQVWWHALIIGAVAPATSSGFWRLVLDPLAAWLNRRINRAATGGPG